MPCYQSKTERDGVQTCRLFNFTCDLFGGKFQSVYTMSVNKGTAKK